MVEVPARAAAPAIIVVLSIVPPLRSALRVVEVSATALVVVEAALLRLVVWLVTPASRHID